MQNFVIFNDKNLLVIYKSTDVKWQEFTNQVHDFALSLDTKKNNYCQPVYQLEDIDEGVCVFARTKTFLNKLNLQFVQGEMERNFFATTVGNAKEESTWYSTTIAWDAQMGKFTHIPQLNKNAIKVDFRLQQLQKVSKINLVKINALLCDTQSIRFGLADNDTPIFGDKMYKGDILAPNTNLALILAEVRFIHPDTHKTMLFCKYPNFKTKPWSYFDCERFFRI